MRAEMSVAFKPIARPARLWVTLPKLCSSSPRLCSSLPRSKSQVSLNLETASSSSVKFRTIDDLPGPNLATTVYWLFVKGYADKAHALQVEQRRLYGPIWRSRFGRFDMVNVAHPELIAQVIRQEGRYPVRTDLHHWREYRDLRGQAYGINVDKGPGWQHLRSALNPKMLKVKEVSAYAPVIHQVVTDLLHRLERLRLRSSDQVTVRDVTEELYKFGFEAFTPHHPEVLCLVLAHVKTCLPPTRDPHKFAYRTKSSTEDAVTPAQHLALTHLD